MRFSRSWLLELMLAVNWSSTVVDTAIRFQTRVYIITMQWKYWTKDQGLMLMSANATLISIRKRESMIIDLRLCHSMKHIITSTLLTWMCFGGKRRKPLPVLINDISLAQTKWEEKHYEDLSYFSGTNGNFKCYDLSMFCSEHIKYICLKLQDTFTCEMEVSI